MTKNDDKSISKAGFKPYSYSTGSLINAHTSISLCKDKSDDDHVKLVKFDRTTLSLTTVKDFGKAD